MTATREQLAKMIDYTLVTRNATKAGIIRVCAEAKKYGFGAVCINPTYVSLAVNLLEGTDVKVCTTVGFPFGTNTPEVKAFEATDAIRRGAKELDMVINVGALKSGDYELVKRDIKGVVEAANVREKRVVKVIIETGLLTEEEKIRACELAKDAGASFVKTSTGFETSGATVEDIKLMRETVGDDMGVKAAGGIRTLKDALAMIKAGANRIGTSTGVAIIEGLSGQDQC